MTEPTATLWSAARRDGIVLTAIALFVLAWGWTQELLPMAAGTLFCALLYVGNVSVIGQGRRLEKREPSLADRGSALLWNALLLLTGSATLILLATLIWERFGQLLLTLAVTVLVAAWQIWFYFWMGETE